MNKKEDEFFTAPCGQGMDAAWDRRLLELDQLMWVIFDAVFSVPTCYDVALFGTQGNDQEKQVDALLAIMDSDELPNERPPAIHEELWELLTDVEDGSAHVLTMARIDAICAMAYLQVCERDLANGDLSNALGSFGKTMMMLGRSQGRGIATASRGSPSHIGKMAVAVRLANDPKQKTKDAVKTYWERWRKQPSLYGTGHGAQAVFCKDMLRIFGSESDTEERAALQSVEVVARWCRAWNREAFGD